MRVKAVVTYDGTGYSGFQIQVNVPTIQAELEKVLERLVGTPTRIRVAGRTDAGVHAKGQVVAFDINWRHPLANLHRGINALLPEQVSVLSVEEVDAAFHPRFDAINRHYRYTIYRAPVRNPLVSRYSLFMPGELSVESMQAAANMLVGQHNFIAFGSPPQGNNAVREVFRAEWREDKDWLFFDIEANAFLYRMVRMLVGTMLRVGRQALTPEVFGDILQQQDRRRAGPAVAARGLCLMAVRYQ